jgi:hypothetical protein
MVIVMCAFFEHVKRNVRRSFESWTNFLWSLGIVFGLFLVGYFFIALFKSHTWGEVAGALGGLFGGLVGAIGAIWAVFLALSRQRKEEMAKVTSAVRTEVTAFVTYIIGALENCILVAGGTKQIPRADASYIVKNLLVDPVVYPAVADRVGLLPRPQATAAFYMRISEAKAMAEMFAKATGTDEPYVTPEFAEAVAESLITALQLAVPIVGDVPAAGADYVASVQATTIVEMRKALALAKAAFPDAASFQGPQLTF